MTHEGGGAKPSKKSKINHAAVHAEQARYLLALAEVEREQIDWEAYDEPHLVKAELTLKEAHVHAMLAVAEASGMSGTLNQTIVGGWRSPYPPAFEDVPPVIPEWAPEPLETDKP